MIYPLYEETRFGPSAEFRGGRFSDTDNITYKEVSKYEDIVWDKKSHASPKETV
jgi:anaerobic sulfite reductase subunit A